MKWRFGFTLDEVEQHCKTVGDTLRHAWTLRRRGLLLKVMGDIDGEVALIREGKGKLIEIGNEDYLEDFDRALGPVQLGLFTHREPKLLVQTALPGFEI